MLRSDLYENLDQYKQDLILAELSKRSINKYIHDAECFITFLQKDDFDKSDLIEYKQSLYKKTSKASTINSAIISINKYLRYLKHPEMCLKQVKTQRKNSVENVITVSQFRRLLRYAKATDNLDTYYILLIIGYSGIRVSELKYFTVENIKQRSIEITNKGKTRTIILPNWLLTELRRYYHYLGLKEGYLFRSPLKPDAMIDPSTVWRKIRRIAGIAKVSLAVAHPHSIRHRFAKQFLLLHPGDYPELADILGHNDIKTTSIYTQTTKEEKAEEINSFNYREVKNDS